MKTPSPYAALKVAAKGRLSSEGTSKALLNVIDVSLRTLEKCDQVTLNSTIEGKHYFSFCQKALSRAVRADLYMPEVVQKHKSQFIDGSYADLPSELLTRLLYTMAISYCAATDVLGIGDRKTPATFFELLIGNIFARHFGVDPRNQVQALNLDQQATLPTDFIFDVGPDKARIHLPIKLSTRERVIQAWAHQRVLDGVYGVGRFRGILVVFAETKVDAKKLEVIEICLPDQWRLYQLFVAQIHRVYYFDVPNRYAEMRDVFPYIQVKRFSDFFPERDVVLSPRP